MEPLTRATLATADVLESLLEAGEPVWGLRIVKSTGRPAGSVYPILERLERLNWASSRWEDDTTARPGPRRRLYELTGAGADAAPRVIAQARARTRSIRVAEAGA